MASEPTPAPESQHVRADAAQTMSYVSAALIHAAEQLRLRAPDILENVSDAFVALDSDWHIVYANHEACRINQKPAEEFLGRLHWDEWPGAVGTELERQFRYVMQERKAVHFEHRYVSEPYDVWLQIDVYPSDNGINLFYRDISARKAAEQILHQFKFLSDNAGDAFFLLDALGRFVYVNKAACNSLGYTAEQFQGMSAVDINPFYDDVQYQALFQRIEGEWLAPFESTHQRADGTVFPIEACVSRVNVNGQALLFSSCRDITQRKRTEDEMHARIAREALLNQISQAALSSSDPGMLLAQALKLLAERLDVDRCFYVLYDTEHNTARIEKNWCRDGIPSLEGEWSLSEHNTTAQDIYDARRTITVDDVTAMPLPESLIALFTKTGQRAYIAVPFFDEGHLVAAMTVMMAEPRSWSAEETGLVEATAIQVRGALDVVRAREQERAARVRQRAFLRDVLASVTDGHLILCQSALELPAMLTSQGPPIHLTMTGGLYSLRNETKEACQNAGLTDERAFDMITAVSEAGMNAVVHVGEGTGQVFLSADRSVVQVRVEDHGEGIALENLPHATLQKGYSSAGTLGHGMKMMLQTADRVALLTGSTGTIVILEMDRVAPPVW